VPTLGKTLKNSVEMAVFHFKTTTGLPNLDETSLIFLKSLTAADFLVLDINIEYVSDVQDEKNPASASTQPQQQPQFSLYFQNDLQ